MSQLEAAKEMTPPSIGIAVAVAFGTLRAHVEVALCRLEAKAGCVIRATLWLDHQWRFGRVLQPLVQS
jgi:hypothetical protein